MGYLNLRFILQTSIAADFLKTNNFFPTKELEKYLNTKRQLASKFYKNILKDFKIAIVKILILLSSYTHF